MREKIRQTRRFLCIRAQRKVGERRDAAVYAGAYDGGKTTEAEWGRAGLG